MRAFDVIGGLVVVGWLSIISAFVYDQYVAPQSTTLERGAIFKEGESYMLLTRESREVGFIHETRTKVEETDGWLLEYDLMMNVSMLGIDQFLETKIKARVDQAAVLDNFSAAITTAGTTFELNGEVEGNLVTMSMDLAGKKREQKIQLKEPPRLSNSALNQLVANPNLEPGTKFEQEYFDPTVMGMTTMTFEYVRPHTVNVFGEKVETFHFRQIVAGNELDAFVDKNGEVHIQEFPLRIVGARLPEHLGRARVQSLRRKFEQEQEQDGGAEGENLSLEATMDLIRGGKLSNAMATSRYRIVDIPEGVILQLDSGEQKVTSKRGSSAELDTSLSAEESEAEPNLEPLLAHDLRVDADNPVFADLLPANAPSESNLLRAEMLARAVHKRLEPAPQIGIQTAAQALETGSGDCTEFSLVLVAALRHHAVPARFVSGLKADENGKFILHQWVQYWDGGRFVDIDATTSTMLPSESQIQLFTHAAPDKPELATIIDQIHIEEMIDDPEPKPESPSDFN